MGKRMRRIVDILTCKETTSKDDLKLIKGGGLIQKENVEELIDNAVDTRHKHATQTSKSAEDIYNDIKVSIDSLRQKMDTHDTYLTNRILSHCMVAKDVGTMDDAVTITDRSDQSSTAEWDFSESDKEHIVHRKEEKSEKVLVDHKTKADAFGKAVITNTELSDSSSTDKPEPADIINPPPLKEMAKLVLVSTVYEHLRADKLAKQFGDMALTTQVNPHIIKHDVCSDSEGGFVFGNNAKIYDMLSRNNNHPGLDYDDGDSDPEIEHGISFRDRPASLKDNRSASSVHRSSKTFTDYYMFPIGSFSTTIPLFKWKDVTTIISNGVPNHRNVDDKKYHRFEKQMTTISQGVPTSCFTKAKTYAVRKIKPPVVCMELLLEHNANKRIFLETHAKFVCVNLMMALRFLHEHDIAHGSLCPRKIIFNENGYPCLTGFEAAEMIHDRPSRPRGLINVEYSSPEQISQDCIADTTDIYSLGVLIYHMIYGKPPHRGKTVADTRRNALDKSFVPRFAPEPISPEGRKLIMKCIRKYEDKRFNIIDKKQGLFESVSWFAGLNEEKLYKQTVPSPLISIISKEVLDPV